jgi:hypothetical protein
MQKIKDQILLTVIAKDAKEVHIFAFYANKSWAKRTT